MANIRFNFPRHGAAIWTHNPSRMKAESVKIYNIPAPDRVIKIPVHFIFGRADRLIDFG